MNKRIKIVLIGALLFIGQTMGAKKNSLKKYHQKRNLKESGEPAGGKSHKTPIFVIQKHNASHLHYDFRLEIDGTLKSWAVPKGPSLNPAVKRLAVETEDHPMDYASFEGVIPEGNYGAGQVIVWDTGTYENIKEPLSMAQAYKKGRIEVLLHGKKLHGSFALVKTPRGWLLIKMRDEFADARRNVEKMEQSAISKKTIKTLQKNSSKAKKWQSDKKTKKSKAAEILGLDDDPPIKVGSRVVNITNPDKFIYQKPKITKAEVIEYYYNIAKTMLPHLKNRPLSMQRFPDGAEREGFYQKDASSYFPDWIKTFKVKKEDGGVVHHVLVNDVPTLVYLANQLCLVFHVWLSKINKINNPDHLIFDLDPSRHNFVDVRHTALQLKEVIESLGLTPFVMTTGSRGLHVVVPLKAQEDFDFVREFARDLAQYMVDLDPKHLTLELRKEKRDGKIFIDYLRNGFGATGVCPYSLRARPNAPVATPLEWKEVKDQTLKPDKYTIKTIFQRLEKKGDVWKNMHKSAKSLKRARKLLDRLLQEAQ